MYIVDTATMMPTLPPGIGIMVERLPEGTRTGPPGVYLCRLGPQHVLCRIEPLPSGVRVTYDNAGYGGPHTIPAHEVELLAYAHVNC